MLIAFVSQSVVVIFIDLLMCYCCRSVVSVLCLQCYFGVAGAAVKWVWFSVVIESNTDQ